MTDLYKLVFTSSNKFAGARVNLTREQADSGLEEHNSYPGIITGEIIKQSEFYDIPQIGGQYMEFPDY